MILHAMLMAVIPGVCRSSRSARRSSGRRTERGRADRTGQREATRERRWKSRAPGGVPHLSGNYCARAASRSVRPERHRAAHRYRGGGHHHQRHPRSLRAVAFGGKRTDRRATRYRSGDAARQRERGKTLFCRAPSALPSNAPAREALSGALRDQSVAGIRARNGAAPRLDVIRATFRSHRRSRTSCAPRRTGPTPSTRWRPPPASIRLRGARDRRRRTRHKRRGADEPRAVVRALASRPEVASLLADRRAECEVDVARSAGWPTATASGGYAAGVDSGQSVHGPAANVTWTFRSRPRRTPAFRRPGAGRCRTRTASRRAAYDRPRSGGRDTRGPRGNWRIGRIMRAREEALRALSAVELGYREGASSSLDVAEARRTATQASVDALIAQYREAQSEALLEIIAP